MVIVYNPAAGRRRASLLWRVLDILMANGLRLELVETARPGDAERFTRSAVANGARLVVAAGGDGTIAEVASGVIGSAASLGVIPLGTANVLANELALPFAPRAVAAALAFGRTRPIWPGLASGPVETRLFVQMLGVGFDADVVHRLPLRLKRALGRGAYVCQTVRELPRYEFQPIPVRIDGEERQAGSVVVSKGTFYGGRYTLAPEAEPGRPGFSVVLFEPCTIPAALMYGAALPLNLLARTPGVRRLRAQEVEFIGDRPHRAQADGDPAGFTPLRVIDAPAPIAVVIG